jgi:hypothetical protein
MIDRLLKDSREYPRLFLWNGGVDRIVLDEWKSSGPGFVHPDVLEIWSKLGGGDIFETETILSLNHKDESDAVKSMSKHHWSLGLPSRALVFHVGLCVSAMIDCDLPIVAYDFQTYAELGRFIDLDSWYLNVLRSEYQHRYGLEPGT